MTLTNIARIEGGDGDDVITGSAGANTIYGGAGADALDGAAGNDTHYGDDGSDLIVGGAGDDVLSGGDGWNSFHGGAGRDVMIGGDGGDRFIYQGNESLSDDVLDGGAGHDEIVFYTEAGAGMSLWLTDAMRTNIEQITGGDGNDAFNGLELTDGITLSGGAGFDYLAGSNGNDTLLGGDGSDFLLGWGGSDILTGGSGGDYFVMRGSGGSWIVTDFELGVDQVQIASTTPIDYDYVMQHAIQVGDNTEIHINDSVMVLEHVQLTGLSPASFSFDLVLA
jgi:Ca2+-binding RTX toxin-like protein